jgi:hypothetical protein
MQRKRPVPDSLSALLATPSSSDADAVARPPPRRVFAVPRGSLPRSEGDNDDSSSSDSDDSNRTVASLQPPPPRMREVVAPPPSRAVAAPPLREMPIVSDDDDDDDDGFAPHAAHRGVARDSVPHRVEVPAIRDRVLRDGDAAYADRMRLPYQEPLPLGTVEQLIAWEREKMQRMQQFWNLRLYQWLMAVGSYANTAPSRILSVRTATSASGFDVGRQSAHVGGRFDAYGDPEQPSSAYSSGAASSDSSSSSDDDDEDGGTARRTATATSTPTPAATAMPTPATAATPTPTPTETARPRRRRRGVSNAAESVQLGTPATITPSVARGNRRDLPRTDTEAVLRGVIADLGAAAPSSKRRRDKKRRHGGGGGGASAKQHAMQHAHQHWVALPHTLGTLDIAPTVVAHGNEALAMVRGQCPRLRSVTFEALINDDTTMALYARLTACLMARSAQLSPTRAMLDATHRRTNLVARQVLQALSRYSYSAGAVYVAGGYAHAPALAGGGGGALVPLASMQLSSTGWLV